MLEDDINDSLFFSASQCQTCQMLHNHKGGQLLTTTIIQLNKVSRARVDSESS